MGPHPQGSPALPPPPRAPLLDAVTATVQDRGDGSYHVAYRATVAGVYKLHITTGEGLC